VGLYYFAPKGPTVLLWIKITAAIYLIGVCLFTLAFYSLFMFSVRQLEPTPKSSDPKKVKSEVESKVELWRARAITAGAGSFIIWWAGTLLAVVVLYLLPRTPELLPV
jgi:hypothetical protein